MIPCTAAQLRNLYEVHLKKKKDGKDSDEEPELDAIRCFVVDHLLSWKDRESDTDVHLVDEIHDICNRSEVLRWTMLIIMKIYSLLMMTFLIFFTIAHSITTMIMVQNVASHIAFDVMPLLLQMLQREQQATDENEGDPATPVMKALERLLQLFGQKAPPREVYSIVMEAVAHSTDMGKGTADVRFVVLLMDMLRNALLRMGDAIRFKFMSSALPTLLSKTKSVLRLPSSANVMHDSEWLQMEHERMLHEDSIFAQYATELVAFIKPFTRRFAAQTETCILNDTPARRERQWVLTFCFHLLARFFSSHHLQNQFSAHEVPQLMHIIAQCNCSLIYLLQYDQRYREWIRHKQELEKREKEDREARNDDDDDIDTGDEQDFRHVREEISQFVQWNQFGVGVFAFLLLVHGIERNAYEYAILSNVFLFRLCKPYMEYMMQSNVPYLSLTGKQLSEHMMQRLPNYSLRLRETDLPMRPDTRDKTLENYFLFMQAVINFMASCPDNEQRTEAYHLLNEYISKFYDDGRFELLRHSIRTCPYPVLVSVIFHYHFIFLSRKRLTYSHSSSACSCTD